ncbi:hypothetical protein [Sorangium sp. So ce1099]|uniref:hypothetical protein n=1 Tax=Sorangium sp. So ce1099 TaxID=3133331 RepID=UPI003F621509
MVVIAWYGRCNMQQSETQRNDCNSAIAVIGERRGVMVMRVSAVASYSGLFSGAPIAGSTRWKLR